MAQGGTAAEKIVFYGLGFALIVLIITFVINWVYPLSDERDLKRHPMALWFTGYALSVFVLSAFAVLTSVLWSRRRSNRPGLASFLAAISMFVIMTIYCFAVVEAFPSRVGLEIVDLMNAKFLAEWQFLAFIGFIAPVCAILSATLTWIELKYWTK
jgi:hypothetical protein